MRDGRGILVWGVIALVLVVLFARFSAPPVPSGESVPYSEFLEHVEAGRIGAVTTAGDRVHYDLGGEQQVTVVPEGTMMATVDRLYAADVVIEARPARQGPTFRDILLGVLPMLLLIGAWFFFMRRMQNGGGRDLDGP